MSLRIKAMLLITVLLTVLIGGFVFYLDGYLRGQARKQTISNLRVMAEISEGSYFAFTENEKIRTIDWSSDGHIRNSVEAILDAQKAGNIEEKDGLSKELGAYLRERKLVYDPKAIIMDILDKDGIVIVSSREDRIGTNEAEEEKRLKAHKFSSAIKAEFGQAFINPVVFEEDESAEAMTHVVARFFSTKKDENGKLIPLDAVALLHFTDTDKMNDMLSGKWAMDQGAVSGQELFKQYKTAEIYLVNSDRLMASSSRFDKNSILTRKVDTEIVKKCFEEKKEITGEYLNYAGVSVLGASMCIERDDLVLVMEIASDEILAPFKVLRNQLLIAGVLVFSLIMIGFIALSSFLLKGLYKISAAAKQVGAGDLDIRADIRSKDEIGQLAAVFDKMLDSIQKSNADLFSAEIRLREERDRLNAIISSMAEGLAVVDKDAKIALLNKTAEKLLEVSLEKARGLPYQKIWIVLKNGNIVPFNERPVPLAISTGKAVFKDLKDDCYYQLLSGKKFPVATAVTPLFYGQTILGAVVVFRDISEIKQLDEAKSGFISIASHQLRTPLTAIRLFIEMLGAGRAGILNKKQKEYIEDVRLSTERMIGLVNDLLNISRIESGRLKYEPAKIKIDDLISDTVKEANVLARERNVNLLFKNGKRQSVQAFTDPNLFRQVIHNLLTNAIRYSTNSKKNDIIIKTQKKDGQCVISVRDFGIGIPDEAKPRLFDRFYRADNAIKTDANGTGIGLYTIKIILERMGGKIWFESKEGKGTVFFITIPIKE